MRRALRARPIQTFEINWPDTFLPATLAQAGRRILADHLNIQTLERINYSANETSNPIVVIAKDSNGDDVSISMSISVAAEMWLHLADALKAIQVARARGAPMKVLTTPSGVA